MTDDTTSITTVSDDEIGSWEDRYERGSALALSHPPLFSKPFKRLRLLPIEGAEVAICDTTVCHHGHLEPSANRCGRRDSGHPACSTGLYHQAPASQSATTSPKPSRNGQPSPSRRSPSAPRRTSGLMVRGTIFYLRVKVPQHLQARLGR